MKSIFQQVGLAVFVSFCSLLCSAQALTRADRPEVKVGDSWVMQNSNPRTGEKRPEVTLTVKEVTADNIVLESGTGNRLTFNRDWNIIETKSGDTVTFSAKPNSTFYQFPLEVGKTWEAQWETTSTQQTTRWQGKTQVEGVETVTVPAGTFQAFKLRFEGFYNGYAKLGGGSWTGTRKETRWYSPDAKRVVKSEWEERSSSYYNVELNELKSLKLVQ